MNFDELNRELKSCLRKQLIGSRIMDTFRFLSEDSRLTGAYGDPKYIPFYYYLGKCVSPESVIEIGFRLGLCSGAFFKSCKTCKHFLSFQEKSNNFYSPRLAKANVRDNYKGKMDFYTGKVTDENFLNKLAERKWGLVIINEEIVYDDHLDYLDYVWPNLNIGGHIVMDFVKSHGPAKRAFYSFCSTKKLEYAIFDTRYGVGIVEK